MSSDSEDVRDGSASICTHEEFAPIRYHWYPHNGETFAQALRVMLAVSGLAPNDQSHVFSEVAARMKKLALGKLRPTHHVKGPMETVTGIDVFEVIVRSEVGEDEDPDALVRVYHAEPTKLRERGGSTIVGLHMHVKDVTDPAQVRRKQDKELQEARRRYFDGQPSQWGFTP
ncbi:hypothetical protein NYQ25_18560 [Curtobacterium flaccumfaciens pv. flaccumfaciens]|uniref:hypothetical protein n=1 Tax=Curtobacterium flaccumfaciens TaxID=2035 RepID=UPI00217DB143|nr:hypothetical protein [Curtobacterium flaccumfaciens]MCS6586975.1 hypothetical protein [Curtobacterium flaccumfaciens pv. flaccumfaciens]